jgi:alkylated DNA repair dioxygenase AlkB
VQLSLLGPGRRVLLDDETGSMTYTPDFIDPGRAAAWFEALRDGTDWHSQRRMMYDREVDVPRLMASFRLDTGEDVPPILREAAELATAECGAPFNRVGLNLYRDGRDSVAPHNDHTDEIREGFPIALLSLGATRRMTIRGKSRPRRVFDLDLEAGSLLVMSYETQAYYDHAIPKTRERVEPRISLAFRVRR